MGGIDPFLLTSWGKVLLKIPPSSHRLALTLCAICHCCITPLWLLLLGSLILTMVLLCLYQQHLARRDLAWENKFEAKQRCESRCRF